MLFTLPLKHEVEGLLSNVLSKRPYCKLVLRWLLEMKDSVPFCDQAAEQCFKNLTSEDLIELTRNQTTANLVSKAVKSGFYCRSQEKLTETM